MFFEHSHLCTFATKRISIFSYKNWLDGKLGMKVNLFRVYFFFNWQCSNCIFIFQTILSLLINDSLSLHRQRTVKLHLNEILHIKAQSKKINEIKIVFLYIQNVISTKPFQNRLCLRIYTYLNEWHNHKLSDCIY